MKYDLINEINAINKLNIVTQSYRFKPDDRLISEYESALNQKFSREYVLLLKNIGYAMFNGIDILTITEDRSEQRNLIQYTEMAREQGVPTEWLPITEDNGDYYCLSPDGKVRFWSHNGTTNEIWDDLASWIHEVWIEGN